MSESQHNVGIKIGGDASGAVAAGRQAAQAHKDLESQLGRTGEQAKKNAEESRRFVERLKDEATTIGKTRSEVERYRASQLQLTEAQRQSVAESRRAIEAYERKQQMLGYVRTAAATATAALIAYVGAVAMGVRSEIDRADSLNKLSQSLGVSTEQLSVYQYQSKLARIGNEQFAQGLKFLAKNISEAQGGVGDGAQLFRLLGREIESAVKMGASLDAMLPLLADKFASFADGPNKTALAMALFGGAGERLIPFLNQGAKGLEALRVEAERLGIVIGGETARRAEQFNDNLTRVSVSLTGLKFAIAQDALPWLSRLAERMAEAIKIAGGLANALSVIGETRSPAEIRAEISRLEGANAQMRGLGGEAGSVLGYGGAILRNQVHIEKLYDRLNYAKFIERQGVLERFAGVDTGDQVSRMMARAAVARTQAPALPRTGTTGETDYQKLSREIATLVAVLQLEAEATDQLTQADRLRVQILTAVDTGTLKLTATQKKAIETGLEQAASIEREIRTREALQQSRERYQAAMAQSLGQQHREIEQAQAANRRLQEQNEEIGLTTEQLGMLRIARAEQTLALAEQREALVNVIEAGEGELDTARKRTDEARRFVDLTRQNATRSLAAEQAKQAREEWQKTNDFIQRSLTDALMRGFESGKGFMQNFRDALVNMFKTLVLEPVVRVIVSPVAGAMTGIASGVAGSLFSGTANASGGLGLLNNGLSLANLFSGGGGGFLGGLSTGIFTGGAELAALIESGTAGFAGAGLEAAAGLGWLGPVGLAAGGALLLSSLMGDDSGPAQRSLLYSAHLGSTTRSTDGFAGYPWQTQWGSADMWPAQLALQQTVAAREQNLISRWNLSPQEIAKVNAALDAGPNRTWVGAGMEWTDVAQSGGLEQIQLARMQAISSALGRSIEELTSVMTLSSEQWVAALDQMERSLAQSERSLGGLARGLPGTLGITSLEEFQRSLAIGEGVSPLERLAAARGYYTDTLAGARGGDLGAVLSFTSRAQDLYTIARDTYASGPQFQEFFAEIRADTSEILDQQRQLQLEILADVPAAILESSQDQIAEIRRQTAELVAASAAIREQLRAMTMAQKD